VKQSPQGIRNSEQQFSEVFKIFFVLLITDHELRISVIGFIQPFPLRLEAK